MCLWISRSCLSHCTFKTFATSQTGAGGTAPPGRGQREKTRPPVPHRPGLGGGTSGTGPCPHRRHPPYPVLQLGRELALELAARPAAVIALDEHFARHGRLLRPHGSAPPPPPPPPPPPLTYGCRESVGSASGKGRKSRLAQALQPHRAAVRMRLSESYWLLRDSHLPSHT